MASKKIYSPNSRVSKLKHAINENTPYTAVSCYKSIFVKLSSVFRDTHIGYMYYDRDINSATGFVLAVSILEDLHIQKFKTLFPTCTRLFCVYGLRYYRVDVTRIFHADNKCNRTNT